MNIDDANIEVVLDNTKLVAREIPKAITKALEEVGQLAEGHVVGYMTKEHIVDTGRLRNSITHAVDSDKSVVVGTNVEYARYVHEGTSRVKGRPYLKAPTSAHADEYREMIKKALEGGA